MLIVFLLKAILIFHQSSNYEIENYNSIPIIESHQSIKYQMKREFIKNVMATFYKNKTIEK